MANPKFIFNISYDYRYPNKFLEKKAKLLEKFAAKGATEANSTFVIKNLDDLILDLDDRLDVVENLTRIENITIDDESDLFELQKDKFCKVLFNNNDAKFPIALKNACEGTEKAYITFIFNTFTGPVYTGDKGTVGGSNLVSVNVNEFTYTFNDNPDNETSLFNVLSDSDIMMKNGKIAVDDEIKDGINSIFKCEGKLILDGVVIDDPRKIETSITVDGGKITLKGGTNVGGKIVLSNNGVLVLDDDEITLSGELELDDGCLVYASKAFLETHLGFEIVGYTFVVETEGEYKGYSKSTKSA